MTNAQDSLTRTTGEKECYEILNISKQIRKGEKTQTLGFIFSSSLWHVECEMRSFGR